IGPDGAGHFVKTIHNGIEYADMQLIGEIVWFFKNIGMKADKIADIMACWNKKDDILCSYLIEITADSMKQKHQNFDEFLVDRVADITRMKGTGTWTVQSALELLVPIPTIAAAVFSREMSQDKELRLAMSKKLPLIFNRFNNNTEEMIKIAHDALYIAKISSYAQGIALLTAASASYNFNLNIAKIAKIWRAGCIIRAQFLDEIARAYEADQNLPNLLAAPKFANFVSSNIGKLAKFIDIAHQSGVPVLAMSSAFDYILQIISPVMPSAQVSALQRDYFGAHGYFKINPDDSELMRDIEGRIREFHTEWLLPGRPEKEITK
ncbi:MAG TPA: NADP-dependent phosphogluconate dehydrogenase, partial [bacterium]|nr:NADP-dependent phosphogluconate dehydrogenase [bacterium]